MWYLAVACYAATSVRSRGAISCSMTISSAVSRRASSALIPISAARAYFHLAFRSLAVMPIGKKCACVNSEDMYLS
jgi:hypothetical protein